MRILHTADLHLGRTFHGADLSAAQQAALDHLVDLTTEARPDVVVVAGDVFDRAYPPLDAIERYDETIARLAAIGVPVVVTSGNHDSAIRLGLHARVAEAAAKVHVRTRPGRIGEPVEIRGPGGEVGLLVYAIPYLDPPSTAAALGAPEATHAGVLGQAVGSIARDRAARPGIPAIAVAHAVVVGGGPAPGADTTSTAERSIAVGGVSAVPASMFAGLDYVALGHLHRPHAIGERVRYSGAPLPYAFDETGDVKSVALVELVPGAAPRIERVAVPVHRPMARVRGTLDELLSSSEHEDAEAAWVEATVTDRLRPRLAMDQLRRRFPHVLKLEHAPDGATPGGGDAADGGYRARLRDRSHVEIAARFLEDVRAGVGADEDERELLTRALETSERVRALR